MQPLFRMAHHSSPNHIQVNRTDTAQKVLAGFDGRRMIAILPGSTFSFFFFDGIPAQPAQL
jgi:hypothetical protein